MSDVENNQQNENQEDNAQIQITKRINQLAAKDKESGLTEAEKVERDELRKEFIANFRNAFSSQVEMLKIVDDQGNDVTPDKVKEIQRQKGLRDEEE